mgnify:CR=1 FL=1
MKSNEHGCAKVAEPMPLFEYLRKSDAAAAEENPQQFTDAQRYDLAHPDIWTHFCQIVGDLIANGTTHYGARAIFEVIRYQRHIVAGPDDVFKLNNNYTSYYSRKFRAEFPQYKDFFETRGIE